MTLSLLTYNVLFNKAFIKLEKILSIYKPDIVCLQEVDTSEDNLNKLDRFGYKLADYSNSFLKFGIVYGVATYYKINSKTENLKLVKSGTFNLPKSIYEMLIAVIKILKGGNQPRTILRTDFHLKNSRNTVIIYNAHLSVFGINRTRTRQLEIVLNDDIKSSQQPIIITGDFNYFPYRRKKLEDLMNKYGFKEATRNLDYTIRYPDRKFTRNSFIQDLVLKIIRKFYRASIKTDYTFFKNLKLLKTERVELEFSDHYPIISTFEIT